MLFSCFL